MLNETYGNQSSISSFPSSCLQTFLTFSTLGYPFWLICISFWSDLGDKRLRYMIITPQMQMVSLRQKHEGRWEEKRWGKWLWFRCGLSRLLLTFISYFLNSLWIRTHFVLNYVVKKKDNKIPFLPIKTIQKFKSLILFKKILKALAMANISWGAPISLQFLTSTLSFSTGIFGMFILKLHTPLANGYIILGSLLASGEVFRVHGEDDKRAWNDMALHTTAGTTTCHPCHCWAHLTFKKLSTQNFNSGSVDSVVFLHSCPIIMQRFSFHLFPMDCSVFMSFPRVCWSTYFLKANAIISVVSLLLFWVLDTFQPKSCTNKNSTEFDHLPYLYQSWT